MRNMFNPGDVFQQPTVIIKMITIVSIQLCLVIYAVENGFCFYLHVSFVFFENSMVYETPNYWLASCYHCVTY